MDIIFDLDGTLANCDHRLHFIQSKPKNWKAFFAGMEHDTPIKDTITVAHSLYGSYNNLIFCTGRPDTYHDITRNWLIQHVGDYTENCPLYMRAKGDGRPDYEVKLDLLATMHADGFDPKIAFEDRDQVVDMWRRNGLICYQVAKGAY
jgi:FMN phosphatase YigB (HAD superfamily)